MSDMPLPFTGDPALTCPWCGTEEPNEFVLQCNHSPESWRAQHERECSAQWLTGNHVRYYSERLAAGEADPSSVCRCHRTYKAACCERLLAEARSRHGELTIGGAA